MRQRGRKSAVNLAAGVSFTGRPPLQTPPASLDDDERALFCELVNACAPEHFRESDLPLLVSFVQATLIARDAARDPDKITLWEKAVRMQSMLATRLRLSPQSRIDPKVVGRHEPRLRYPWESDEDFRRSRAK
jgi:hypothetical protein